MDGKVSLRTSRYQKMAMERELAQQELDRTRVELRQVTRERDELEAKLSMLLDYVTGGRFSKSTYSIEDMKRYADDYQQSECEMCEELAYVKRELKAAKADMQSAQATICTICKNFVPDHAKKKYVCEKFGGRWSEVGNGVLMCGRFEWRGVQEVAE